MIKSHYLQSACKRCCLTLLFLISLTSFNASSYDFTVDGIYYTMLSMDDLTCEVSGWDGRGDTNVTIPAIVTYKGRDISVIQIGKGAFKMKLSPSSITLPSSIRVIREEAFYECDRLSEVNLGDGLISIGKNAFRYCKRLKEIFIPSKVKEIGLCAFYNCISLQNLSGGAALESIGECAFEECTSLQGVINFRNIEWIESEAFYGCKSLTDVIIPATATGVSEKAFYDINLNTLKIEDGESSISFSRVNTNYTYRPFYTARVKQLYIGREISVGKVDNYTTFSPLEIVRGGILELGKNINNLNENCISELDKIGFLISHNLTPPSIPEMSNSGYVNIEVRVPAEALEEYKQAPVWKNFWNIKAIEDESGISDIECDDDYSFQVYDTNGILVDASCTPEKLQQLPHGVYIVVKQDKRMKIKL